LEAGAMSLDESEFSVKEMLDAAVGQHTARANAKGLRLFSTLEAGLPETIVGDALRTRELLGHLIADGIKFDKYGTVEVSACSNRTLRELVIEVRDTGIGIAEDRLETIFESFRQVDGGLSRNQAGLGLGLALARKLAMLMNGRIEVSSTLGAGSVFTIRLPLRLAPAQGNAGGRGAPAAILIVEEHEVGMGVLG